MVTYKGILVCVVVFGGTDYWLINSTDRKTDKNVESCLENISNLGKGLALYRTDNDGYSPVFTATNKESILNKLSNYAGSKPVKCSIDGRNFQFRVLRRGASPEKSFYGTDDLSVVVKCESHLRTKMAIKWNGLKPRRVNMLDDQNPGDTNILLRNGSAKSIRMNSPRYEWIYDAGKFVQTKNGSAPISATAQRAEAYTFEPKPPQFER